MVHRGAFTGIIGLALAIFFHRKSKIFKALKYVEDSRPLIQNSKSVHDDVEVTFKGNHQENLTVSRLTFWNSGRKTIDANDVATAAPITIVVPNEHEFLAARILYVTDEKTKITISNKSLNLPESKETGRKISFEFLEPGDGAVVQILHTAKFTVEPKLIGKIKGITAFQKAAEDTSNYRRLREVGIRLRLTSSGWLYPFFSAQRELSQRNKVMQTGLSMPL